MPKRNTAPASPADLRARAVSRLTGDSLNEPQRAAQAFSVLHELASSPSTAADALALLHELQVHQVELDLQAEELRASRAELETALQRQVDVYDAAPVGQFTVDARGALRELNLTGAALLGAERDALLGQPLSSFLAPGSAREFGALLAQAGEGQRCEAQLLQLVEREGVSRTVHATVGADPAGGAFLVALMPGAAAVPPAST